MGQKKKILFVFTGGTINSAFNQNSKYVSPNIKSFHLLRNYIKKSFQDQNTELIFREPLGIPGADSSNINPVHWVEITGVLLEEMKKGIDGILILYGTDTMAYFSSWLTLCFPYIDIPIIITGSQLTLDYKTEDVTVNLSGALQVVCSDFPGVWIYCNWKLIPGNRAHKARASHPDMFIANNDKAVDFEPKLPQQNQRESFQSGKEYPLSEEIKSILHYTTQKIKTIYEKIEWLMCVPGGKPKVGASKKIICIYGFGAGNAPRNVLDYLDSHYLNKAKPFIIACSQAERDTKKPEYYESVGIAGLAQKNFKVWSQLDYPIEFIHSLAVFALLYSPNNPEKILSKYLEGPY